MNEAVVKCTKRSGWAVDDSDDVEGGKSDITKDMEQVGKSVRQSEPLIETPVYSAAKD